jgi:hypothetical protein
MKPIFPLLLLAQFTMAQSVKNHTYPVGKEIVRPIHKTDFNNGNSCPERKQGGNPRMVNGYLVFNGSMDGDRQVDPQIAVGGGYILEGSNRGLLIYTKEGKWVNGVSQNCFNNGIDPKMFFDIHDRVFVFDMWWYYDKPKTKPVNIAVSESSDPTLGWNIYPVSRTEEEDGGAIGYSRKWIGYSYPGGEQNTFIMRMADAKAGKPATIYHFKGSLGLPVFTQDPLDVLYFVDIDSADLTITKIMDGQSGDPYAVLVSKTKHGLTYIDYPPSSPQKGTKQVVASGDRNPKNLVIQNGYLWFSQTVLSHGRSAVQWNQVELKTGKFKQSGILRSDTSSFIQTSIAVNKRNDVLVGFQETNERMFVSPRFAYRSGKDKPSTIRKMVSIGEGESATDGESWGDYSGSILDGDNLLDLWSIQSRANAKGKAESVIVKVPGVHK